MTKTLEEKCAERKSQRQNAIPLADQVRQLRMENRNLRKRIKELETSRDKFKARAGDPERKRRGTKPNLELQPRWRKVRRVADWALWMDPCPDSKWISLKLISTAYTTGKANYWMGYNHAEGRWSRGDNGEHITLQNNHPELWAMVLKFIEEQKQWL